MFVKVCNPTVPGVPDAPGTAAELLEDGAVGDDPARDAASVGIARCFGSLQA